jgi:maltose phosphorylase
MKNYIKPNEWTIVEEGFDPHLNKVSESIFSIGNGRMGQRANFEEKYSGETLLGNYVAGVYYPDKTRVGWWKNGYPEYFAKVLNAANWVAIDVNVNGETLDLNTAKVTDFNRTLNMREGYLERSFVAQLPNGNQVQVNAKRFCSIADDELAAIHYQIIPLNFSGTLILTSAIDGDVKNQDANYDEKFWDQVNSTVNNGIASVTLKTKKTAFEVCTAAHTAIDVNQQAVAASAETITADKYIAVKTSFEVKQDDVVDIYKYASNVTSQNYEKEALVSVAEQAISRAIATGYDAMLKQQAEAWASKWEEGDILIEGDVAAQQAIRFNIFQLNQTYTGKDVRLNIGPKGFTGEKYGGSTYWDTEAYCIPFYLATAPKQVAKNLLIYRHNQLQKAIENAEKLGFHSGAALYPMVTMNGEECHNEWEITFEEIHRNGAIAFAIYNYIRYTGDQSYLAAYGLEVLIGIARFWKQRVNWSAEKNAYVILGVTGPNEYENNINNNWYTNKFAAWCMRYAKESLKYVKAHAADDYDRIIKLTNFNPDQELADWTAISDQMYYPYDKKENVFLQQDGFMDKEQVLVADLADEERPLNQKWSWDRILRSCFIKQADVLQGMYFFEDEFDQETLKRNFSFYESRTVHESSLSPCVHSILASRICDEEKAYEFYLRTARLDLDDYNNDTEDGLHITSMAGTWMSIVEGFAGMKVRDNQLQFNPFVPSQWKSFSFNIGFRNAQLKITISSNHMTITNYSETEIKVNVLNEPYAIPTGETKILFKEVCV